MSNPTPKKPSLESHEDKLNNENEVRTNEESEHTKKIFNNLLTALTSIVVIKS